MLPEPEALAEYQPTERLAANARPTGAWRDELRRIPNVRNAFGVALVYVQTIGIILAAVHFDNLNQVSRARWAGGGSAVSFLCLMLSMRSTRARLNRRKAR